MTSLFIGRAASRGAAAFLALALTACQSPPLSPPPDVKSRTETVLDAQYAASGKPKPMQAAEADRIYEEYLKSIGEEWNDNDRGTQR
ncbi:MAG: hypothetical protein KF769_02885 [Parvibaculum sp.]|nr:hypothetical protein [Parvibaculum sp.]